MSKILMRIDGSCYPNPGNMGIGIVIYQDGELVNKISEFIGQGTNNIAEYRALIRGLEEAKKLNPDRIDIYCDSKLVVKQLNGNYKVKDKKIIPLFKQAKELSQKISAKIYFIWNSRDNNSIADGLAKNAVLEGEIKKREELAKDLEVKKYGDYFLVNNLKTKKSYKVDIKIPQCECADFVNRAKRLKIDCKHIIAVRNYLQKLEKKGNKDNKLKNRPRMKILVLSKMVKPQVWKNIFTELNQKFKLNLEFIVPEGKRKESIKKYLPVPLYWP